MSWLNFRQAHRMASLPAVAAAVLALGAPGHDAWPQTLGKLEGRAFEHTPSSAEKVVQQASLALPSGMTGGGAFFGKWQDRPRVERSGPVVLFLHGSSGLNLSAIADWQKWLSGLGIASVAPDSFALPERLTYTSPVEKSVYERIHALRASEVALTLVALSHVAWVDPSLLVLAGTSEGATTVARNGDRVFAARMIFSWSCEDNYFVEAHRTAVIVDQPVLNMISSVDPFFSPSNSWLGNASASGNCAAAFSASRQAVVALVPGAPHTLINLPYARAVTRAFLEVALSNKR